MLRSPCQPTKDEDDHVDHEPLANVPLFAALSADDLRKVAERFQDREMLAGTTLAQEGDFSYKFFVVLDGEVEIQRDFQHLATLGPGAYFGEVGVITGERRNARVLAATRCHVAWMMTWDFEEMTKEFPQLAAQLESTAAERSSDTE
jgi:CRP-like cAMP-binding protein